MMPTFKTALAMLCVAQLHAYSVSSLVSHRRRSTALRAGGFGTPPPDDANAMRNPDLLRKQIEERGNRVFDELCGDFPTVFRIKVFGAVTNDGDFATDMVGLISEVTGESASAIEYTLTPSSGGKYVSVTINAPVASPDDIYACYAKLRSDKRVKMAI